MSAGWGITAAIVSLGVVLVAFLSGGLTASGASMAWLVGTATLAAGGPVPALAIIAFFATSTLLTRVGTRRKAALVAIYAKGGRRDWGQVLANGGLTTVLAVALGLAPLPWRPWLLYAAIGALAAATADTWATEVGGLHPAPRLITTGRRVPPGTSGAISPWGLAASLGGGALLGACVAALSLLPWPVWNPVPPMDVLPLTVWAALAGGVGSIADSFLGATVQAMYRCPRCGQETERRVHVCGTPTERVRGRAWMSNDVVNFAATLVGSIMAVLGRGMMNVLAP